MTHRPSIIAPRAFNRWAVWAVSLKVENRLDFRLPKLPINKFVDNFMAGRLVGVLVRAPPASNGPRRRLPKLPIGKATQNIAALFVSGWSAGWRGVGRADGRVTVTGTDRKQFLFFGFMRNKFLFLQNGVTSIIVRP
jgi:hypothetical protein